MLSGTNAGVPGAHWVAGDNAPHAEQNIPARGGGCMTLCVSQHSPGCGMRGGASQLANNLLLWQNLLGTLQPGNAGHQRTPSSPLATHPHPCTHPTCTHPPCSWQTYYHRLNNVMVSNQRLSALLGSLLGHWEFTVPEVQLRRGLVYTGSNHRLRAVVQKAMSGQPVKIGVVGELRRRGGQDRVGGRGL